MENMTISEESYKRLISIAQMSRDLVSMAENTDNFSDRILLVAAVANLSSLSKFTLEDLKKDNGIPESDETER